MRARFFKSGTICTAALVSLAFVQIATAAVPVVESQGTVPRSTSQSAAPQSTTTVRSYPAAPTATAYPASGGVQTYPAASPTAAQSYPAAGSGGASERAPTTELFYQLQTLQSEVSELRGLIEEQRHLIDRLSRDQKEQYQDLDRRVALALKQGGSAGSTPTAPVAIGSATSTPPASSGPAASVPNAAPRPSSSGASERDTYTNAFNLTRDKRFQEAINAFNQLLVDYPNGEYSANAFYWLGELYLALPQAELEKSRQSFSQVVNVYPSHAKVPDSLYKLGVVYHRLGDSRKALEYLTRAQSEFPTSPASRLAQSYAAEIR